MAGDNPRGTTALTDQDIARWFDGGRLRQARQLALCTKQALADAVGVSAAAVGQYESGATSPRPALIPLLADRLDVRREFFTTGRPHARLETSDAYFRSLRSTTARQRAKAISYTEQLWELVHTIEKHVQLPSVELPGFGSVDGQPDGFPNDPIAAARQLRKAWKLGTEPVAHLVRTIENHGIVTVFVPLVDDEVARIDAFSTLSLSRPVIVLTPDRAQDVYRHRFTAAHELGHLVLHGDRAGGDPALERDADRFAAEFLTPSLVLKDLLPRRVDFRRLQQLSVQWGVSVQSLIYRSREVGLLSDATARRAYIRLNEQAQQGLIATQSVNQFAGEIPSLLRRAVDLADAHGVTVVTLADELAWKPARVRQMLGAIDERPALRLL